MHARSPEMKTSCGGKTETMGQSIVKERERESRRGCLSRHSWEEVEAPSSVGRDSVGQMSAVWELAAEVQELRLAVRKRAGSIMWDRGAAILGKRFPERIVEQTVDMQRRRSRYSTPTSDVSPSVRTVGSTSMGGLQGLVPVSAVDPSAAGPRTDRLSTR